MTCKDTFYPSGSGCDLCTNKNCAKCDKSTGVCSECTSTSFYLINGATAIPCGVNFTVHSYGATSCELLLYKRMEDEPYAVLKFPDNYRIGKVYSMIVFGLNIHDFEYAYRLDGPYEPKEGLIFNKNNVLQR